MVIKEITSLRYTESGAIDCEVLFEGMSEAVPYTATPDDTATTGQQIWQELQSGKWGEIALFTVTPEMVEAARAAKHREIEAWRAEQEAKAFTFEWNGRTWDADQQSMARLSPVAAIANTGMRDVMSWGDANNEQVPLNAGQLKELNEAMALALIERNHQIYQQQREMKAHLNNLSSLADIRGYEVGE